MSHGLHLTVYLKRYILAARDLGKGKLRELRVQVGKARYRILYYGALRKRAERIPERDKQLALERMQADERCKAQKGSK